MKLFGMRDVAFALSKAQDILQQQNLYMYIDEPKRIQGFYQTITMFEY